MGAAHLGYPEAAATGAAITADTASRASVSSPSLLFISHSILPAAPTLTIRRELGAQHRVGSTQCGKPSQFERPCCSLEGRRPVRRSAATSRAREATAPAVASTCHL